MAAVLTIISHARSTLGHELQNAQIIQWRRILLAFILGAPGFPLSAHVCAAGAVWTGGWAYGHVFYMFHCSRSRSICCVSSFKHRENSFVLWRIRCLCAGVHMSFVGAPPQPSSHQTTKRKLMLLAPEWQAMRKGEGSWVEELGGRGRRGCDLFFPLRSDETIAR